ncbi:hypothetical protein HYU23_03870 [Candidatus Woesearchaeota archaeon]|nr:hypothetical protein [Candidatus Woesearchaeota archaeon]
MQNKKRVGFLLFGSILFLTLIPAAVFALFEGWYGFYYATYTIEDLVNLYYRWYGFIDFIVFFLIFGSIARIAYRNLSGGEGEEESGGAKGLYVGIGLLLAMSLLLLEARMGWRLLDFGPIAALILLFLFLAGVYLFLSGKDKLSLLPALIFLGLTLLLAGVIWPNLMGFMPPWLVSILGLAIVLGLAAGVIWLLGWVVRSGWGALRERRERNAAGSGGAPPGSAAPAGRGGTAQPQPRRLRVNVLAELVNIRPGPYPPFTAGDSIRLIANIEQPGRLWGWNPARGRFHCAWEVGGQQQTDNNTEIVFAIPSTRTINAPNERVPVRVVVTDLDNNSQYTGFGTLELVPPRGGRGAPNPPIIEVENTTVGISLGVANPGNPLSVGVNPGETITFRPETNPAGDIGEYTTRVGRTTGLTGRERVVPIGAGPDHELIIGSPGAKTIEFIFRDNTTNAETQINIQVTSAGPANPPIIEVENTDSGATETILPGTPPTPVQAEIGNTIVLHSETRPAGQIARYNVALGRTTGLTGRERITQVRGTNDYQITVNSPGARTIELIFTNTSTRTAVNLIAQIDVSPPVYPPVVNVQNVVSGDIETFPQRGRPTPLQANVTDGIRFGMDTNPAGGIANYTIALGRRIRGLSRTERVVPIGAGPDHELVIDNAGVKEIEFVFTETRSGRTNSVNIIIQVATSISPPILEIENTTTGSRETARPGTPAPTVTGVVGNIMRFVPETDPPGGLSEYRRITTTRRTRLGRGESIRQTSRSPLEYELTAIVPGVKTIEFEFIDNRGTTTQLNVTIDISAVPAPEIHIENTTTTTPLGTATPTTRSRVRANIGQLIRFAPRSTAPGGLSYYRSITPSTRGLSRGENLGMVGSGPDYELNLNTVGTKNVYFDFVDPTGRTRVEILIDVQRPTYPPIIKVENQTRRTAQINVDTTITPRIIINTGETIRFTADTDPAGDIGKYDPPTIGPRTTVTGTEIPVPIRGRNPTFESTFSTDGIKIIEFVIRETATGTDSTITIEIEVPRAINFPIIEVENVSTGINLGIANAGTSPLNIAANTGEAIRFKLNTNPAGDIGKYTTSIGRKTTAKGAEEPRLTVATPIPTFESTFSTDGKKIVEFTFLETASGTTSSLEVIVTVAKKAKPIFKLNTFKRSGANSRTPVGTYTKDDSFDVNENDVYYFLGTVDSPADIKDYEIDINSDAVYRFDKRINAATVMFKSLGPKKLTSTIKEKSTGNILETIILSINVLPAVTPGKIEFVVEVENPRAGYKSQMFGGTQAIAEIGDKIKLRPQVKNGALTNYDITWSERNIVGRDKFTPPTGTGDALLEIEESGNKEIYCIFTKKGGTSPVANVKIMFPIGTIPTNPDFIVTVFDKTGNKKIKGDNKDFPINLDMKETYLLQAGVKNDNIKNYTISWKNNAPGDNLKPGKVKGLPGLKYESQLKGPRSITCEFVKGSKVINSITVSITANPNLKKIEARIATTFPEFEKWGRKKQWPNKKTKESPPWNMFINFLRIEKGITSVTEGIISKEFSDITSKVWKRNKKP